MAFTPASTPLKVGLTGGIASGKSLAAEAFRSLGVTVVDADDLSREVVAPDSEGLSALVEEIGQQFLDEDGRLHRSKLREAIFRDPGLRQRVEAVLHPRIVALLRDRLDTATGDYVVGIVPLLTGELKRSIFHRVVLVDCPVSRQIERLMKRDGETRESARRILDSQPTREDRLELADDILSNDAAPGDLIRQVETIHDRLRFLARE